MQSCQFVAVLQVLFHPFSYLIIWYEVSLASQQYLAFSEISENECVHILRLLLIQIHLPLR